MQAKRQTHNTPSVQVFRLWLIEAKVCKHTMLRKAHQSFLKKRSTPVRLIPSCRHPEIVQCDGIKPAVFEVLFKRCNKRRSIEISIKMPVIPVNRSFLLAHTVHIHIACGFCCQASCQISPIHFRWNSTFNSFDGSFRARHVHVQEWNWMSLRFQFRCNADARNT